MALPKNITFVVKGRHLEPYGPEDALRFEDAYGEGEIVETQQPVLHAKFYAILNRVLKENVALPWDTAEELADALKRAAGATYACETLEGKAYLATVSVAAIKDFPSFFDKATRKLADYLKIDHDDLIRDPRAEDRQEAGLKEMRDRVEGDPWEYSRAACVKKMLAWSINKDVPASKENRERLEAIVAEWRGYVGPFADHVGTVIWDVKCKNIAYAAGKRLLEAQLAKEELEDSRMAG